MITFIGKVSHAELLRFFRNYDILLFPSIWEEHFALIVLEAMAQGLPIIASRTGGTPEVIKSKTTGILVPPGDSKKMAEAIKKLIKNPSLYEQISINGIKEVREKYTNEKVIGQIERYLTRVYQKRNSRE